MLIQLAEKRTLTVVGGVVALLAFMPRAALAQAPDGADWTEPETPAPAQRLPAESEAKENETEPDEAAPEPEPLPEPVASSEPSELQIRIKEAQSLGSELDRQLRVLRGKSLMSAYQARAYEEQILALIVLLDAQAERAATLEKRKQSEDEGERDAARNAERGLSLEVAAAEKALNALSAQFDALAQSTGSALVDTMLRARCATAICFANGESKYWLGIEPLVELPIGKSFSLSGSALSAYVNNHEIDVDLAAGLRVWIFRNFVNISVYLSQPLSDAPVRLEGSPFTYPATSLRRPYPGVGVGVFYDSLWFGFDREELINGDGRDATAVNPAFAPNATISSSWTLTVAIQPVTAFRTALTTAVQSTERSK